MSAQTDNEKCELDVNYRFNCLPDINYNKYVQKHAEEECQINGCCWNPNGTESHPLIPKCFYPTGYRTYNVIEQSGSENEVVAVLER